MFSGVTQYPLGYEYRPQLGTTVLQLFDEHLLCIQPLLGVWGHWYLTLE